MKAGWKSAGRRLLRVLLLAGLIFLIWHSETLITTLILSGVLGCAAGALVNWLCRLPSLRKISPHGRKSFVAGVVLVSFEAPLANLLTDFYDQLKSITSGYGSFNYELSEYRAEDLVKLDFYVANERVDSLSVMVHRSEADRLGSKDTDMNLLLAESYFKLNRVSDGLPQVEKELRQVAVLVGKKLI